MNRRQAHGERIATWLVAVICTTVAGRAPAQEPVADPPAKSHAHEPIEVDVRPIVSRLPLSPVQPRRLLLTAEGHLFVADWGGGAVLRLSPDGRASVIAEDLDEPAGLAMDPSGNLYVSTHAAGMTEAGTIVQITPAGEQSIFAAGLTGPTDLAFDEFGNLYVANFHDDTISVIGMDGRPTVFAEDVPAPAALAFDKGGTLLAVSATEGTLLSISPVGQVSVAARGLMAPSDIAFDAEGHLIVANYGGTRLTYVNEQGGMRAFALVPQGTMAIEFNGDGNLLLANWDEGYVLEVTTRLWIPCPHCESRIPLRLRSKRVKSPPEDSQPMI